MINKILLVFKYKNEYKLILLTYCKGLLISKIYLIILKTFRVLICF